MKKTIFLAAFAVLFSVSAHSQFKVGIKAGANIGKIDGVPYKDQFKFGYQLGGFVSVGLGEKIAIQPEVLFSQTNTKMSDSYATVWDEKFDKGKTLNYVSVPVLLKYNPQGFISLVAGPQFSILTNKDENLYQNGKKLFKNSDFGMVAGAEINIGSIFAFGRYVWGFSDISKLEEKATSQQIEIGVGVRF